MIDSAISSQFSKLIPYPGFPRTVPRSQGISVFKIAVSWTLQWLVPHTKENALFPISLKMGKLNLEEKGRNCRVIVPKEETQTHCGT